MPAPTAAPAKSSSSATLSPGSGRRGARPEGDSIEFRRDSVLIEEDGQRTKSAPKARGGVSGETSLLTQVCYLYQDVYYNIYTGEVVSAEPLAFS